MERDTHTLFAARAWRWWGAAAGFVTGLFDAGMLAALGVGFRIGSTDATWMVGAYFGLTFAALGFLLGTVAEGRRRERAAAERIRVQAEHIDAARERLRQSEKLAALGQLAAAVAHEVRNPLGVIRSAAQEIQDSLADSDRGRRACSFITAEIDRLNNVIASLLAFARPLKMEPDEIAIGEIFDRALLLANEPLASRRIRFHRSEAAGLPAVRADRDLLSQVLLGLLDNAARAVPDGGEVTLEACAAGGAVEVAVSDNGPGVPAELRARVFEPFFTTRAGGTGLGLAIARQIVEAHGGRIDAGERPGGGARFSLSIPVARPASGTCV